MPCSVGIARQDTSGGLVCLLQPETLLQPQVAPDLYLRMIALWRRGDRIPAVARMKGYDERMDLPTFLGRIESETSQLPVFDNIPRLHRHSWVE